IELPRRHRQHRIAAGKQPDRRPGDAIPVAQKLQQLVCAGFRMPAMRSEPRASGPAAESRQGTNPRAMVCVRRRAVGYGDLAEAEGAWKGARWAWARALMRLEAGRGLG